jgi:hypothetical protein
LKKINKTNEANKNLTNENCLNNHIKNSQKTLSFWNLKSSAKALEEIDVGKGKFSSMEC